MTKTEIARVLHLPVVLAVFAVVAWLWRRRCSMEITAVVAVVSPIFWMLIVIAAIALAVPLAGVLFTALLR